MADSLPIRLPRELQTVADELRKTIRLSRNGRPRVFMWFNLNSGREHYYLLKKAKEYEVYAHFYSRRELVAFCRRYHFDSVDMTEVTYEGTTRTLDDLQNGG